MKIKNIMICGVLSLVISCAAVEPAKVENGLYINQRYQFSLGVPAGWKVSEEIPPMLKKGMSFVSAKKFKAAFSDLNNKRFILVMAEKTETDWVSFRMYADKVITSLDNNLSKEKTKFLKKPGWKDYRYRIYEDRIYNCDDECIASKFDFHFQDLKATGQSIIYKSDYAKAYTVSLILIAREEIFETSLRTQKAVVDSFQRL